MNLRLIAVIVWGWSAMIASSAYTEQLNHRFGPGSFGDPAWERRFDAQSKDHRLDPAGWNVSYPQADVKEHQDASTPKQPRSGGFRSVFLAEKTFQATLRFRLGNVDKPPSGSQPGVFLRAEFNGQADSLVVGAVRRSDGDWWVQGRSMQSNRSMGNFQTKATDVITGLVIERSSDQIRAFWLNRRNERQAAFELPISAAFEKPAQLNIWVTDGAGGGRVQVTMQSVEVDAGTLSVGYGNLEMPPSRWRYVGWASLTIVLVGGAFRSRSRLAVS